MGVIVTFPKTTRAPPKTRQRKKRGPWVFADLKGKKPKGHAPVRLGPRGRVLIAEGQVWVGGHNQRLWVTQELVLAKHRKGSLYPHDIILTAYRGKEMRILAETTVRLTMKVWEMYIISQKELMKKFDHMSRHDPQSPFRGRKDAAWAARRSFGLDEKGNRIR